MIVGKSTHMNNTDDKDEKPITIVKKDSFNTIIAVVKCEDNSHTWKDIQVYYKGRPILCTAIKMELIYYNDQPRNINMDSSTQQFINDYSKEVIDKI